MSAALDECKIMNILLVIHHELDPNAGAPGSVIQLGRAYEQLGHSVQFYSFDHLPQWTPNIATGLLFPEFLAAHLIQHGSQQSLDVIDASTGDAWVWGSLFRHKQHQRPLLVTHSHGLEHTAHLELLAETRRGNQSLSWKYPIYRGGFHLWEVATSLRCADVALMLNQRDANYAVHQLGIPSDRVQLIANGIPDRFLNLTFESASLDPDTPIAIAQIGTYIPRKGIHYSIPALNTLLAHHPYLKLSFLGTCCSEEQVYADFEPSLHGQIRVIPRYAHSDLPTLLKGHHILLFPSLSEGFPLALPEAMACGLAPIASAIPGVQEIVKHEENGILIPARDRNAIEAAVCRFIRDRAHLERLRQSAYQTAQTYSWNAIAKTRLAIYATALEHKRLSS